MKIGRKPFPFSCRFGSVGGGDCHFGSQKGAGGSADSAKSRPETPHPRQNGAEAVFRRGGRGEAG
jgi:hypothetical protein